MVQDESIFGRIWDSLVNRYEQDENSDCCGATVEDVSDSKKSTSES